MNNNVCNNTAYRYQYLNYVNRQKENLFSTPDSIGKLPRINMKLPDISMTLANVELLV